MFVCNARVCWLLQALQVLIIGRNKLSLNDWTAHFLFDAGFHLCCMQNQLSEGLFVSNNSKRPAIL